MRKTIFRFILFLFVCLFILTLSNNLVHAQREASMRLEIPIVRTDVNVIIKDFAASATRFYLLYVGLDPEKKVKSYIRKVYVFDHEGTRRPNEEFELEPERTPHGIAVTSKLVYISYFTYPLIDAYDFDGNRLPEEDIANVYGGGKKGIAATETHFITAEKNIYIYKFQDIQGDENGKRVSYVRRCKGTTTDAEGGRPYVAATDTRVYVHNPYDPTIYVYDAQDGGRRAREDFNNDLWHGKKAYVNVPRQILSGIATTPLGGKLFILLSQSRSDGKRGYEPVVYRYSIPEEVAERPVIDLPAKPPATPSYYFRIPWSGSGIAATDTNVYVAAGGGFGTLYGRIYGKKYSDGVPGSLYADSGKKAINFSLYDHYLYSEGMTVDYHNLYILRKHYLAASSPSFADNPGSAYSVRYCSLNSEASVPQGATLLIDLELPMGMENFGKGIGLAIDSEGILYAMDSGVNEKGAPRIYRFNPSTKSALPGNPITLHPNHRYPCGITIVKNRAYVLDRGFNYDKGRPDVVAEIFVYALDGPDVFEYLPEESFTLDVGGIHPEDSGIAINGDTFFISMMPAGVSGGRDVYVYGPPSAPSWKPIPADTIRRRQPYQSDISYMSRLATDGDDWDKYQAIASIPWTLSVGIDSDFLFGNPEPTITFAEGYRKPEWLTLKDNVLSGTPPSAGKYTVELTASNENGNADTYFTVNVAPAPVAASWLDFSVPEARINDAWLLSLTDFVTGNPKPRIYFTPGFVPPKWLKLKDGVLSCIPSTGGIFPIKLTAGTYLNPPKKRNWADIVIYLVVKGTTSPSWLLDTLNDTAQGIAATDSRVYVADLIDDKIYVYGQDGKRYEVEDVSIKKFTNNPLGITTINTNIYIVDNRDYTVSILDATENVLVDNFQLHPDNQSPTGITATTIRLYVVDNEDDKVYVYTHDGTHQPTEDVSLYDHREPTGITATSTRLYVVDGDADKIYAYGFDGKLQSREVVELVSENRSPTGITATSSHLLVVDFLDQKVYSYPIPATVRPIANVGAPSWDPVPIPEAEQGSNWMLSLAKFAKGAPMPQIDFTDGYTSPDWLTLEDGVLSGTPTKAEVASIQVTATNSKGSANLIITLTVMHPEVPSWDLNPGEFNVQSIAATKTHVYVLYGIDHRFFHISVYTHDGIRVPEMDIELGEEHMRPWSITANETDLYMVMEPRTLGSAEPDVRRIYRFDLTGSGETQILELEPVEGFRMGNLAAVTETRFYALSNKKISVFGLDGTHYPNENFPLYINASEGLYIQDIALTQTRIYILTNLISRIAERKKIYVYGHDGTPYSDENFVLSKIITGNLTVTSTHLMAYSGPPFRGIYTGSIFLFPLSNMEGITEIAAQHPDTTPAWDVNQDGQIDIRDLIEVAQYIGETEKPDPRADVNGDGTIDIRDLLIVSQHLGESTETAAPFRTPSVRFPALVKNIAGDDVTAELIQTWIDLAQIADDGSLAFKRGIVNLKRLLDEMLPKETELLANYPNPFNPETWIPYHLAKETDVQITIYDIKGSVVRQLDLGQKAAGNYSTKSRAAYWNGHNADGEKVASGIYFYQLRAGNYEHTRRMLIVK
ncbi:MAG: putative Ig domain-containing protein [Candidatus Poribacteria bacterium]|nr:putative Ig domain-containing protein [Candidatus Poribacteria bacterium]